MKPRKVIITIDAKSDMPLKDIKEMFTDVLIKNCEEFDEFETHQVHVQVVKEDR